MNVKFLNLQKNVRILRLSGRKESLLQLKEKLNPFGKIWNTVDKLYLLIKLKNIS